jgi:hypothetical protein
MSEVKNYGLSGIAANVELGKGGPRFKNNATVIEMRNAADSAFAVVAGAEPTAAEHFATKAYVDRLASVAIKGQMINDVAKLPDNSGPLVPTAGDVVIVTTVGASWDTLKRLLRYTGSAWTYLFSAGEPEGLRISVTDATSGGGGVNAASNGNNNSSIGHGSEIGEYDEENEEGEYGEREAECNDEVDENSQS